MPCSETAIFLERYDVSGDGPSVAFKDVLDRAGEVTRGASRALSDVSPAIESSDVVTALEASGCALVGRTNMHELAYGVTGINQWTGTPINPKYPRLIPGGSSSGSAVAVAGEHVDFAIGTDTGGSIRVPAACCGIIGLKPGFGRVSRKGAVPEISSLDCIGPFARTMAMIEEAMAIIVPDWVGAPDVTSARIGYFSGFAESPIAEFVHDVAARTFDVEAIELPRFEAAVDAGIKIIGHESWKAFGHLTKTGLVGRDVHDRLVASLQITDDQLAHAEVIRTAFQSDVNALLDQYDALALPTLPCAPPSLLSAADSRAAIPITAMCRPFNLSGHPAISLPVGEIASAPVALQLVGRQGNDEALCALARTIPLFETGATL